MNRRFNPYTGLYHHPDGHRTFKDGGLVDGVNYYSQSWAEPKANKMDDTDDDTLGEAEARNGEVGRANSDAERNEKNRQAEAADKVRKEQIAARNAK